MRVGVWPWMILCRSSGLPRGFCDRSRPVRAELVFCRPVRARAFYRWPRLSRRDPIFRVCPEPGLLTRNCGNNFRFSLLLPLGDRNDLLGFFRQCVRCRCFERFLVLIEQPHLGQVVHLSERADIPGFDRLGFAFEAFVLRR
jgi:hypothetical protein